MRNTAFLLVLLFFYSCHPGEEVRRPVVKAVSPPPESSQPGAVTPELSKPSASPLQFRNELECLEDTGSVFNRRGLEAMPFFRPVLADIDGDHIQEMIAGTKDGSVSLYKNSGTAAEPLWHLVPGYFSGVSAGAFAAPAFGDIDQDGIAELLVGTGGFSSASGRVRIFKNSGTVRSPAWNEIPDIAISVGNDAAPALADVDADGRPDLIVGNSAGELILLRNSSDSRGIRFRPDAQFFAGIKAGMYAMPAAIVTGERLIVLTGNSMGSLLYLEKNLTTNRQWKKQSLRISVPVFSSPAFTDTHDLLVTDGNGRMHYFKNSLGDFLSFGEDRQYMADRVFTGPACAPAMTERNGRPSLITGNINGKLSLFEATPPEGRLPWREINGYFSGIALSSFGRGLLSSWEGRELLISGQQDGRMKAFINKGKGDAPQWSEIRDFFRGLPAMLHAAPSVYDIDADGQWELIVGDAAGDVRGFRYSLDGTGRPRWEELPELFNEVHVGRFATPVLFRQADALYLISGQQSGELEVFVSAAGGAGRLPFRKTGGLKNIRMSEHSSPSVLSQGEVISLAVGDYRGGLRHFECRLAKVEIGK